MKIDPSLRTGGTIRVNRIPRIDQIYFAVYPDAMDKRAQTSFFAPGDWISLPEHPEWGLGRVQSALGTRLTASFENAGKQALNSDAVTLVSVEPPGQGE